MLFIRYIIFFTVLTPMFIKGQNLQHSVLIGTNFSYLSSSNPDAYPIKHKQKRPTKHEEYMGVGASLSYGLEYQFPKIFSVGTFIDFFYSKSELHTPCYCNHSFDRIVFINNSISTYNTDLPIYFKLRTNKLNYTYFTSGVGISLIHFSNRNIQKTTSFLTSPQETESKGLGKGSFTLTNDSNNKLGTFFHFGLGHTFKIKQLSFSTELSYRQDFNSWVYNLYEANSQGEDFPIKRHILSIKIGFNFSQNKK